MPNKWTFTIKPIRELLRDEITDGLWIDPFAGEHSPAALTNDLNPARNAAYHMDALDFLRMFQDASVDGVLFDPPYSPRQVRECYDSMGRAKDIVLKVIPGSIANPFIKAHHYSGSVVGNSKLHFGVFLDGALHGVMSYGPSMNKQQLIGLVAGTGWNEFMELNRMTFDSVLPRNSESRAISMSLRLIRKYAPQVKWVVSFADACSCGDGTICRAANFVLTGIKPNEALCILPDGTRIHKMTLSSNPTIHRKELGGKCYFDFTDGRFAWKTFLEVTGARLLEGW